jgi:hypothetical protein
VLRYCFFKAAAVLLAALPLAARAEPSLQTAQTSAAELDYLQHCSGCHQSDGAGSAANHVPSLPGSVGRFVYTKSGRAFVIQVGGVAQAPISDAAVASLLNWMLPAFDQANLPADFTPFTGAEVAAARASRPGDIAAARARVVAELHALGFEVAKY